MLLTDELVTMPLGCRWEAHPTARPVDGTGRELRCTALAKALGTRPLLTEPELRKLLAQASDRHDLQTDSFISDEAGKCHYRPLGLALATLDVRLNQMGRTHSRGLVAQAKLVPQLQLMI